MGTLQLRDTAVLRDVGPGDAEACAALSRVVGWPHRTEDWAMAIGLGRGLVGHIGADLVATALWFPYGESHATLGLIIVGPAHQGKGLGRRLMQEVLAQKQGRSLLLNATLAGQSLYEKVGFVACGAVSQHQGEVLVGPSPRLEAGATLRAVREDDLPSLHRLDGAATGLPREALLRAVLEQGRGVVLERGGEVVGFSLLRRFGHGQVIGPVVAAGQADAEVLVAHWVQGLVGQFVRIDVKSGSPLSDWLLTCGLKQVDQGTSMVRGDMPEVPGPVRLHALTSQALG
ncbi:hypothetical protein IP69_15705 [Bosea sp. AAP35]|uniref:GNAT family N-acetyltransferase n=1 Tax=Bosea sp. AAP35 TaxID=1523417 RepID=UPI0006CD369D|nr:GNAT family N-acetyltransferase [Bosea sp. AAP35]KPF66167.1 hypothetical protein IP69_15705 [Bosea sp. AAP35]